VATVRAAEAALMAREPVGTLMARAAAGLAATCGRLLEKVYGSRVVVLVGSGDNGGDALFAGALLARRGAVVTAILLGTTAHVDGLAALRRAGGAVSDATALDGADLVLDGIVGIGGSGALRPAAAAIVGAIPPDAIVVAVDVPSGVDADTGVVEGAAVNADVTVTFGTWKPGLLLDPGAQHAGAVELVDIGLAPYLPIASVSALQADDVRLLLPQADAESDKYRRGVVGVVAGSDTYTGAALLATGGALRAGAGMVRFVSVAHPAELVRSRWPEAVVTVLGQDDDVLAAGRVQAWVVGPGIGTDTFAERVLAQVLSSDRPVVVDADALTIVGRRPALVTERHAPTVLTPHAGELTRLLDLEPDQRVDVEARRLHYARAAAHHLQATVLLKGSTTVVCAADGLVRVNSTGTPWLATAGSGDVLSGIIGALLAGGLSALDAASCAAYLHGAAGRLAADGAPVTADDLVSHLQAALRSLS
ncbi:MAG: ADP-dependent NAD(P)H-hydrate dehydratase / NAD(P)H-hydrate epimerase, partial [Actinomycetota bacterium]|nr:ADP-dependent NAD(P)H-hydrate dehydratase / NAD(P)H-hydrate epimerase [Actinomycetota bacterium]